MKKSLGSQWICYVFSSSRGRRACDHDVHGRVRVHVHPWSLVELQLSRECDWVSPFWIHVD